jgi:hypothetical protein
MNYRELPIVIEDNTPCMTSAGQPRWNEINPYEPNNISSVMADMRLIIEIIPLGDLI